MSQAQNDIFEESARNLMEEYNLNEADVSWVEIYNRGEFGMNAVRSYLEELSVEKYREGEYSAGIDAVD